MKVTEEIKKLRAMKPAELVSELEAASKKASLELLNVRAGKSADTAKAAKLRKNVARINTILSENQGANND